LELARILAPMLPSNQSHVQQSAIVMTVLVTGFGPFGEVSRNPSELIAAELDDTQVAGEKVVGRVLPVSAARTPTAVREAIAELDPSLVVLLGVAPGRAALAAERVALNVFDFQDPDNDGEQPIDVPIRPEGPAAYFSTLPLRAIVQAWQEAGIPGYVSDTAGTYLCNAAMYSALDLCLGTPAGFVHIPSLPEEAAKKNPPAPSMTLETMTEGVRIAIRTSVAQLVATS
jgi:pyroglutamyl-peptidase